MYAESSRFVLVKRDLCAAPVNIGGYANQMGAKSTQQDVQQRLQKLLQGAFAGLPTPLGEIPKRGGRRRAKRMPAKHAKQRRARDPAD
jgi:hypothetical protein